MDEDIVNYIRNRYSLLIGNNMAELVKKTIGSAYPLEQEKTMIIRGRNLVTRLPEAIEISSAEIRYAIRNTVSVIIAALKDLLNETPPELASDLIQSGICLTGGGALLQGLAARISDETDIRTWVSDDPLTNVACGAGLILQKEEFIQMYAAPLDKYWQPKQSGGL